MINYTNAFGNHCRYPNANNALINWFVDEVESEENPIVFVASGDQLIDQVIAAVERRCGQTIRIDRSLPHEIQCKELLRCIHRVGGLTKLKLA